jgi:NADH-quinone oxidoreductase subunit M
MLSWPIYISFLGAVTLSFVRRDDSRGARAVAISSTLASLAVVMLDLFFRGGGDVTGIRTLIDQPWIPTLGIRYHLGADGISCTLILLTALAGVAGVLFSWNIEKRPREFFMLYLVLIGAMYGVFLSLDLFLFFVFYELAIIPKYFLISIWGSTNREYGGMKLALYSLAGSALVLIVLLAAYVVAGAQSMDLLELSKFPFTARFQMVAFPIVFVGFAILAGLWPFHTWAPTGHVAAPTAASMMLAGVVMKLGAYGALRVGVALFPLGLREWHVCFGVLALIGIIYGASVALVQRDFKFVIGYSSVSHMGFVLLGLVSLNAIGLGGAVFQMFSHGIIAGLLFGIVGRMIYDRTHTRDLEALKGMSLSKHLPFAAGSFAIAAFASMGLPGFSGFVAELSVLIGAWHAFPTIAVLAGIGILVGVAFTLRALQQAFFTEATTTETHHFEPITIQERLGTALLIGASVWAGLFPHVLMNWIHGSFNSPLFEALRKGGLL